MKRKRESYWIFDVASYLLRNLRNPAGLLTAYGYLPFGTILGHSRVTKGRCCFWPMIT